MHDGPIGKGARLSTRIAFDRRHGVLLLILLGSLTWMLSLGPLAQDVAYHGFADERVLLGIPHASDVLSNLPFLAVGLVGLRHCLRADLGAAKAAWIVLFTGIGMVGAGSAYYHWSPTNGTLVWDRLPMAIGFMGLFSAVAGECVHEPLARWLLLPSVLLGLASVVYWVLFDDLRLYLWVQLVPLLTIPAVILLFEGHFSHGWVLLAALAWYALAKVAEAHDAAIFDITGETISGHSLKHLLAAAGCYSLQWMLHVRKPVSDAM